MKITHIKTATVVYDPNYPIGHEDAANQVFGEPFHALEKHPDHPEGVLVHGKVKSVVIPFSSILFEIVEPDAPAKVRKVKP